MADERADQARTAALDAGLDADVADVIALIATGDLGTYEVRYPGPVDGTELRIVQRPPDRLVQVLAGETVTETRLVVDGEAFECVATDDDGPVDECERVDAFVDPPGVFDEAALARLTEALVARADQFTFTRETIAVAGVEATCLVTRRRAEVEDPALGASGTICASDEGALLLVDQGDERLEATAYTTDVADDAFVRPDA